MCLNGYGGRVFWLELQASTGTQSVYLVKSSGDEAVDDLKVGI